MTHVAIRPVVLIAYVATLTASPVYRTRVSHGHQFSSSLQTETSHLINLQSPRSIAILFRWKRRRFSPSREYYGEIESINIQPRGQPEVHQLFCGGDWEMNARVKVNFGVGFDLGGHGPGTVLKSRFEWDWGSRQKR
jgi:hypothetical protein